MCIKIYSTYLWKTQSNSYTLAFLVLRLRWKLKSGSIWYSKYYEIWKLPSSHFSLQIIFSLACNLLVVSKIAWMVKYPIYIWEYSLLNNVCMMYLLLPSSIWLIYLQYSLYPHIINSHLKIKIFDEKKKRCMPRSLFWQLLHCTLKDNKKWFCDLNGTINKIKIQILKTPLAQRNLNFHKETCCKKIIFKDHLN